MTTCDCSCHINPYDWAPVCPKHRLPLYAAEAGRGQCPWIRTGNARPMSGGLEVVRKRCVTWEPESWVWRHRDMFNGDELPPYNGFQAPRYPELPDPHWSRHTHRCKACDADTVHVLGDNRSVCTACGAAVWVPDPQYVNVGDPRSKADG